MKRALLPRDADIRRRSPAAPLRVLLVEDSVTDADLIVRALRGIGRPIDVERVETAAAMRGALEGKTWDLVVADWSIPTFGALAALAMVKESGLDLPFIIVSETFGDENVTNAMRSGAHDYVLKDTLGRLAPAVERELRECEDRAARRRAERALRASEARFRSLSDSGIIGILVTDLSGRLHEANDAFLEIVGYSREDFVAGRVNRGRLDDPGQEGIDAAARATLQTQGVARPWEKELVHKDGRRIPVLAGAARVDESSDEIIAFVMDLTERKRTEAALRLSEQRYRGLKDSGVIGIVLSDTEGNIKEANDAFLAIVGYTQADLRAGKVSGRTLNTPERERTDAAAFVALRTHGVAHAWEKELVRKDGSRAPVLMGVVLLGEANESVAFALDLTERKRAEAAARESEARKAAVMEAALDAIVLMDHEGNITEFNAAAERTFGYTRDEVVGKPLADVLVPASLRAAHTGALLRLVETGEHRILGKRLELPALKKDGTEFPAELAVVRIRSEGPPVFTGYIRDITERREAEESKLLRREKEAAEAANRELEAFSYSVAHDLRAPLRAINGFANILREDHGDALAVDAKALIHRIVANTERMAQMIDALLSLARLSRTEVRLEPIDLTEMARTTLDRLRMNDSTRKVDIVVAEGVVAKGDSKLLRLVLENLLGNAWKFTRNESAARIELGCHELSAGVVYFVRDNGAGFDPAYAEKLFAPFQRLHSTDEFEGTGVGLATVQRIIERHGGRVWAEGKVHEGASFMFTLPDESSTERAGSWTPKK